MLPRKLENLGTKTLIAIVIVILASSFIVIISNAVESTYNSTSISTSSSLETALSNSTSFNSPYTSTTIMSANTSTSSSAPAQMRISLPLYAAPSEFGEWNQVDNSTPATGILIINPDYGPGYSSDPGYISVIQDAQRSGIDVLGYVSTSYADGSVSIATLENQITEWYSWYHVDGIFFDEVNSTCSPQTMTYYSALYNFTKQQMGPDLVVLNPGAPSQSCYGNLSDILVTFEGDYSVYVNNYVNMSWTFAYPKSHFLQIIYNATTITQMQQSLFLASQRHAGWVFVTDRPAIGVNALGRLPYYFCQEAQAVNLANTACLSSNTTSFSSAG